MTVKKQAGNGKEREGYDKPTVIELVTLYRYAAQHNIWSVNTECWWWLSLDKMGASCERKITWNDLWTEPQRIKFLVQAVYEVFPSQSNLHC